MDLSVWRNDLLEQGVIELPVSGEIGIKAPARRGFFWLGQMFQMFLKTCI
jgi:hypothetical protein